MDQATARRRAKALNGIAVGARWSEAKGAWILGGWANHPDEEWIVVNVDKTAVLADDSGQPWMNSAHFNNGIEEMAAHDEETARDIEEVDQKRTF
jgi:hypothetical protein